MRRAAIALLLAATACESSALGTHEHLARLRDDLAAFGLTVEPASTQVATLGWHAPPAECTQVYRLVVGYDPLLAHEEPSTSWLAFADRPDDDVAPPDPTRPIPAGETLAGRVHYEGIRVQDPGVVREVWLSSLHAGPASPTAGCLGQTWDPIEDAMTLGWPKLTGRLTAVDDTWTGLRVEGKCNKSACADPETGRGGADNPKNLCVTPSFTETFAGVYEIAGERFALVTATWSDGHGPPDASNTSGIWSERETLISLEHGRPTWGRATIHYNFPLQLAAGGWGKVTRTWELQSIDTCAGSLASIGWARDEAGVREASDATDALAHADELRASRKSSDRQRASIEQAPQE